MRIALGMGCFALSISTSLFRFRIGRLIDPAKWPGRWPFGIWLGWKPYEIHAGPASFAKRTYFDWEWSKVFWK